MRPITIVKGMVRATTNRNAQLYVVDTICGRTAYRPRKDEDAYIAVLESGVVMNILFNKEWLDEYFNSHADKTEVKSKICECGKEKHGFANHSNWCDLFERVI